MREAGHFGLEAYTPFPVQGLPEALGLAPTRLPRAMLAGGIAGAVAAYGLILWSVFIDYPINVGGRPLNAWPAYLVLAFEAGILGAVVTGFFALMRANGLPQYHHPVFDVPGFSFAEGGGFWLQVDAEGEAVTAALRDLGAVEVEAMRMRRTAILVLLTLAACRQDMDEMPRNDPMEPSGHFADGMAMRLPVPARSRAKPIWRRCPTRFRVR